MKHSPAFPDALFHSWLLILVWAPLPLASNRPWVLAILIFLCSLLGIGVLANALIRNTDLFTNLTPFRWPIALLAGVALWSSLQLLVMPLELLAGLSPKAAETWAILEKPSGSLSLDPERTQFQAAWSWGLWTFFCASLLLLDTHQRVRTACWVIVCSGVCQALYGSFMTLSGLEYGFFMEKQGYRGVATGTFVNRNHLAGYLEMCLAVGIGLLVSSLGREKHSSWRSQLRSILDAMLGSKIRLRIFLALMVIALVLTHSRMGNSAFFASLMICGLLWMILQKKFHKGAIILFVSLVLIDTLIVGQWFGFEEVVNRLESTSSERETRDEVIRDSLVLLQDYPITGTGLGSYASVFPQYQQDDVRLFYDHAHNDYLQFSVELGVIGIVPLVILVLLSFGRAIWSMYARQDYLAKGLAFAASMGILALMIHSAVDFNLQMPANALLFIVLLAFAWISGSLQGQRK